jgi:hypothetical protein
MMRRQCDGVQALALNFKSICINETARGRLILTYFLTGAASMAWARAVQSGLRFMYSSNGSPRVN